MSSNEDIKRLLAHTAQANPEDPELVLSNTFKGTLDVNHFINLSQRSLELARDLVLEPEKIYQKAENNPEDKALQELSRRLKVKDPELLAKIEHYKTLVEKTKEFKVMDLPGLKEAKKYIEDYGVYSAINEQIDPLDQLQLRALKEEALKEREGN